MPKPPYFYIETIRGTILNKISAYDLLGEIYKDWNSIKTIFVENFDIIGDAYNAKFGFGIITIDLTQNQLDDLLSEPNIELDSHFLRLNQTSHGALLIRPIIHGGFGIPYWIFPYKIIS